MCPVDLKPDTLNAVEAAASIASAHRAQLVLLHVFTKKEYETALTSGKGNLSEVEALQQTQQHSLDALCNTLLQAYPALQCITMLRQGSIITTILEEAKAQNSSLIVMGSHGVHDITEAMDGNHPVKVIERAPCPVLCLPEGSSFEAPARVVYGSRMKEEDPDCLRRLISLLHPYGSPIEVVHVGEITQTTKEKWVAHEKLVRSYITYEKMRFHLFPWSDESYQGINEFMLQKDAHLLVLLTHQRNFLQRLFQKSVFKQISYFSEYPVLVFLEDHLRAAEE